MGKNKQLMFSEKQMSLFEEYQKTQDVEIRNKIVEANLGLAKNVVVKHFKDSPYEFDDLVQMAVIGLVNAVEYFDPTKGYKFSTYATISIKNHLLNEHKKYTPDPNLISIDEPVVFYSDEPKTGYTLADFIIDEEESQIAKDLEIKNLWQRVYDWVLANCDAREIVIFEASTGLHGEPMTGQQISEQLGISTQRVFEVRKRLRTRISGVFHSDFDFVQQM